MHKAKMNGMYHIHHEFLDSSMLETSVEVKEIEREVRSRARRNNTQVHSDYIVDQSKPCYVMYNRRESRTMLEQYGS